MATYLEVVSEEYAPIDRPQWIGPYKLGAIIGEGRSGVVRAAVRGGQGKAFAVKILNKLAGQRGKLVQLQFQQEVDALRQVSHDHVVTLHECMQTQRRFYIVLELISGVLLSTYVRKKGGLTEDATQWLSRQLSSALACLHEAHVIHRDFKPANVMIDTQRFKVTLMDFGLSSSVPGNVTWPCGTPAYMAPEVTSSTGYGCVVDMWSLGATIVEMLTGAPPNLKRPSNKGAYLKHAQRQQLLASLPLLSTDCLDFLDRLLQVYPEKRITSTEALSHPWITEAADITVTTVT